MKQETHAQSENVYMRPTSLKHGLLSCYAAPSGSNVTLSCRRRMWTATSPGRTPGSSHTAEPLRCTASAHGPEVCPTCGLVLGRREDGAHLPSERGDHSIVSFTDTSPGAVGDALSVFGGFRTTWGYFAKVPTECLEPETTTTTTTTVSTDEAAMDLDVSHRRRASFPFRTRDFGAFPVSRRLSEEELSNLNGFQIKDDRLEPLYEKQCKLP